MDEGRGNTNVTPWLITIVAALGLYLLVRNSSLGKLLGSISGLAADVADTGKTALATARNAAADLDPFNKKGKLHKAGDAVGATARTSLRSVKKKLKKLF